MKKTLLSALKHGSGTIFILLSMMLGGGLQAWGDTTYYIYKSTDQSTWTSLTNVTGSDSEFEFTIDVSGNTVNTDYYYGATTCNTSYWNTGGLTPWSQHILCGDVTNNADKYLDVSASSATKGQSGTSNCDFRFIKIKRKSSYITSVKVTVIKKSSTWNSCGTSTSQWQYTVSNNIDTYTLKGEFTEWEGTVEFEENDGTYTASIILPASRTYNPASSTGTTGFVIEKNGSTTYGKNTTITKASRTATLDSNSYSCGLTTTRAGEYTFSFTLSDENPVLEVIYPVVLPTVPTVYWGDKPVTADNDGYKDISASAYIAAQGCDGSSTQNVSDLQIRLWKEGDEDNAQIIPYSRSYYELNNAYDLTISYKNSILANCTSETTLYMEVAGKNATGWSDYSDRAKIRYLAASKFVLTNLTPTFKSCNGEHQFTLSDMVMPTPESWTVSQTSPTTVSDAKSHFTESNGTLIWNKTDFDAGTYVYEFTFSRDGYTGGGKPTTATLTISFSKTAVSGEIGEITTTPTVDDSSNPTSPWTPITLATSLTGTTGVTKVQWSVSGKPTPVLSVEEPSTTAIFKAKVSTADRYYTITAKGITDDCVSTTGVTKRIKVTPDTDVSHTIVLIGDNPVVEPGPEVTLSGYVKAVEGSKTLKKSGFYYLEKTGSNSCANVVSQGTKIEITNDDKLSVGGSWNATILSGLKKNTEYYYRAYAKDEVSGTEYISKNPLNTSEDYCSTFTTQGGCDYPSGDTIYYTIDASLAHESRCHLQFKSFESALSDLKSHNVNGADDYWWDGGNNMLKKNVVFLVAAYADGYGTKNSRVDLSDINKYNATTGAIPTKRLVIRPLKAGTKPIIWGMYLANSRWVTVNSMNVQRVAPSSKDGMAHSCVLIGRNDDTNNLEVGMVKSADLKFVNCVFSGDNFCCIHASAVDGLYLENNNLIAECDDASANTRDWGASIKFMNCKNVTLIRNNFKGAHSNNIFSQNTRNLLIMNNVFWNDNKKFDAGTNRSAIIRLLNFEADDSAHDVKNVGIYYNTLYLAKNDANSEKVDFLIFGGKNDKWNKSARYDATTIEFKYNNCYSYSTTSAGKTSSPFLGKSVNSTMTNNNFWSANDADFSFGSNKSNVDMSITGGMICTTTPNTPEGMVIKGSSLNLGAKIVDDAVTGLRADTVNSDRLAYKIRPVSNWTYGAYQQREGSTVHTIIWNGGEDTNWDNRNNWVKPNGELVTCLDLIADDVEAVIPEPNSINYPLPATGSISKYPVIPEWVTPVEGEDEKVRAGISPESYSSVTNFAKTIEMEYGSTITGVENLKDAGGAYHYHNVSAHLTVDPKEWVLVGSLVRPFKDKDKAMSATPTAADTVARLAQSGDFYLYHMPHVYMQQFDAATSGDAGITVSWGIPFTQLDESVATTQSFAIFVADQFGENKEPAAGYYKFTDPNPSKLGDGDLQRTFNFTGRYSYEHPSPSITFNEGVNVLNNAYPAVLNANVLKTTLGDNYSVYLYDYGNGDWDAINTVREQDQYVKPQSGFIVRKKNSGSHSITLTSVDNLFDTTKSTKYKRADANVNIIIRAYNIESGKGSKIGVGDGFDNAEKIFNGSVANNVELYILDGDTRYSTKLVSDMRSVIPLGLRNKSASPYPVRFELVSQDGIESAVLEDRGVSPVAKYDLLSGETPVFIGIDSGDLDGRFFLNLNYAGDEEHDIPTNVEVAKDVASDIQVFVKQNVVTITTSDENSLKQIIFTDIVGRSFELTPQSDNMSVHALDVPNGTYIVSVVAENMSKQQKIIINKK